MLFNIPVHLDSSQAEWPHPVSIAHPVSCAAPHLEWEGLTCCVSVQEAKVGHFMTGMNWYGQVWAGMGGLGQRIHIMPTSRTDIPAYTSIYQHEGIH